MRSHFHSLLFLVLPSRALSLISPTFHPVKPSSFTRDCLPKIVRYVSSGSNHDEQKLPTVEQASSDPFMKQISHASQIVSMIHDKETYDEEALDSLLRAQLSHSDGIRAFFATYLSSVDEDSAADEEIVPQPVVKAIETSDASVMVPLALKNVIMPTAMSTLHTDPELQSYSALTAKRGVRILSILSKCQNKLVETDRQAIIKASSGTVDGEEDSNNGRVQYWEKFFETFEYGEQQKQDIADTMKIFS